MSEQQRIKEIVVKVFFEDEKRRPATRIHRSPNGKVWLPEAEDRLLEDYAGAVEREFPGVEYRVVSMGKHRHNFLPVKQKSQETVESGVA